VVRDLDGKEEERQQERPSEGEGPAEAKVISGSFGNPANGEGLETTNEYTKS